MLKPAKVLESIFAEVAMHVITEMLAGTAESWGSEPKSHQNPENDVTTGYFRSWI